jgi:membrane-associated protease RseP (regulator of RpoE activity)
MKVIEAATKLAALDDDDYNITTEKDLEKIPNFLLKILAAFVGMDVVGIDKKEFVKRWNMTRNLDYSFFTNVTEPIFTPMDIERKKCELLDSGKTTNIGKVDNDSMIVVTKTMLKKADGNATQLALYALECDYYLEMGGNILTSVPIEEITPDFMMKLFVNESYFGSMYPKCVTSRDENQDDDYISEEPTSAQIDVLTKTILPAIKFSSSSKPMKVPGGWAITGNHKFDNGDELLDAIDKEISKTRPNLMEQITVLYTPSYGPMNGNSIGGESLDTISIGNMLEEETLELFAETEPILYITGPDIVRKPNRVGLTLTSIAGIATSWYLSVYPFLLNDQIASRVDADLKLVEANLQPDLSYLTEYSVPLFLSFIGLQLIHEAAHRLVAMSKDVKLSVPVFVPSFITGITSSVMTFKTLPKNKNDMFDIAAAGPLAGVVASCIALVIGAKLTLISDPSMLPALPLDILRQSTLGGAIVDNIISGSLFIPEGAPSAGINIPLHPLAIAGYTSLIVNALALLPIGSKLIKLDCFALLCLSVRLMHE